MSDLDRVDENDEISRLDVHLQKLRQRTVMSLGLYVVFIVMSVLVALDHRSLEDPLTWFALGLFVCAFLLLPRDYVPPLLARKVRTEEGELKLDQLRQYQRIGLIQRIVYGLVAILTLIGIPWLMVHYGV